MMPLIIENDSAPRDGRRRKLMILSKKTKKQTLANTSLSKLLTCSLTILRTYLLTSTQTYFVRR